MSGAPALHPWNRGFQWSSPSGPFRRITAAQAEAWDRDGYFVLEDAVAPAEVAALVAAIDPIEARVAEALGTLPDGKFGIAQAQTITFSVHLVTRSDVLRRFSRGPLFADLCHDLIGDDARLYWDQAVYKHPGRPREFPWHQDNGYTYVEPQQYVTCWLALSDARVENGGPWVVPGIHRRGTLDHWLTDLGWRCLEAPEGAVALPLRAGSIAVFSSLTPHRTGPNTSGAVRKAYILQYAPEGAEALRGNPAQPPIARRLQAAPDRQLPVLAGGLPVQPARPGDGRPASGS